MQTRIVQSLDSGADIWQIAVGDRQTERVLCFPAETMDKTKLAPGAEVLLGYVRIKFNAMDQWFEEDTPIFVHPKDPFKRVDILASTRPLSFSVGGVSLAETRSSVHLYETGLPCRYYIPLTAINPTCLRRSQTRTQCPYKGEAEYYDVVVSSGTEESVVKDLVWYYTNPTVECAGIRGLCCFYNEKVDIKLDGFLFARPETHFS